MMRAQEMAGLVIIIIIIILTALIQARWKPGKKVSERGYVPDWNTCLPGESWTQDCWECHCTSKGRIRCRINNKRCKREKEKCIHESIWLTSTKQCHCSSTSGGVICIDTKYQAAMNNQPCENPGSFLINDCMMCQCEEQGHTFCQPLSCSDLSEVCNPGEVIIKGCHQCTCSHTMFNVCEPISNCEEDKPGHCPSPTRDINQPDPADLWCLTSILHECYGDMDCPGSKKCCQHQCYYVCVAPGMD